MLSATRRTWLSDALSETLRDVDPSVVSAQIGRYAPADVRAILSAIGIRDEYVFPTPIVLESKPTLVGYYRLLIGVGQKSFYRGNTGMGPFQKMEREGVLVSSTRLLLPEFCAAMSNVIADLIRQIASTLSSRDVHDLQLLTLGSNFYGGTNNTIGQAATLGIFAALAKFFDDTVSSRTDKVLAISTPAGRTFSVVSANDPDVSITETTGGGDRNLVAIEIKGGSDTANVYNRGGEAEKSHQAAKAKGYGECWTVIRTSGIDLAKLMRGSQATDFWFDTTEVLAGSGVGWDEFERHLRRITRT